MNYDERIATELNIRPAQVAATIKLLDDGNTLPFIARYRKEVTDALDEDQIRHIQSLVEKLRTLDERRQSIVASIDEQGKLTPELHQKLLTVTNLTELEDLYAPYRPKRRTRASVAREKGLQGLADLILQQPRTEQNIEQLAVPFLTEEVPSAEDAFVGARDIVAETISEHAEVRGQTRQKALRFGLLQCRKPEDVEDARGVYQVYHSFDCRLDRIQAYQILAVNRGEAEKILKVQVEIAERDWRQPINGVFRADHRSPLAHQLESAIDDAAQRLLLPAIERDVRRTLTEEAETHAIAVFASNLKGLLSQPPLANHVVMGVDPAYRTGCKLAIVDPTGKVLDTNTIYPHAPQRRWDEALQKLAALVDTYNVSLIVIGNGTASRETEQLVAELTRSRDNLRYLIVNEAGASVYSASELARSEMPELDVTLRGAVSIARRAQDPLAELVKIDPKAIGVGLYQHDVNQKQLAQALDGVVESAVNLVGVDLNTASGSLLTYVAGVGPKLAERIVSFRNDNGPFPNRKSVLKVSGLGAKSFEQAAGFLRVRGGDSPLDSSAIHPESYKVAEALLKLAGLSKGSSPAEREPAIACMKTERPLEDLAVELGTGVPTLADIFEQLVRPGRDPREELPLPLLRSNVLSMDDLQVGMQLFGTVRNVVDFGTFIDIGVKQDGLLHRSQLPAGVVLSVGSVVEVEIMSVEQERGRISLTWPKKS